MELSIIKQIKELRNILRRKPKSSVEVKKAKRELSQLRPVLKRREPVAKKKTTVLVDGKELTLSQVAKQYNLELATVRARYRVGNKGKLLIRPNNRKKST